jgi:ParB/RepB/Spo0J family partition protein
VSKKQIRDKNVFDLLNQEEEETSLTARSIDEALYSSLEKTDSHRQMASPVSINEIYPDLSQPRRALPHKVRKLANWQGDAERFGELFDKWVDLVNQERGVDSFNLAQYLEQKDLDSDEEIDRPDEIGPIERTLVELVELATSIRNDGLTNPITVIQVAPHQYQVETGERRWLAYNLLYLHTQDDIYSKISARVVDKKNIWRQAAENNARANLNAISKARQFAVLLMDLLQGESGIAFTPFASFFHEQGYYAQVADGEDKSLRIPRGKSERLIDATGLKSAKQLREYRGLLRLPTRVWDMADDLNWTERFIRDLITIARDINGNLDEDKLIILAEQEAAKVGYTVPTGTVSEKRPRKKDEKLNSPPAPGDKRYYTYLLSLVQKAKAGKEEAREDALMMIDEFRRWLDEEEHQLLDG